MIKHHQNERIRQLEDTKGWPRCVKQRRKSIREQWRGTKRWQRGSQKTMGKDREAVKRQWGSSKGCRRVAKRRPRGTKEGLKKWDCQRKWVVINRQWGGVEGQCGGGERQRGGVKGQKRGVQEWWDALKGDGVAWKVYGSVTRKR